MPAGPAGRRRLPAPRATLIAAGLVLVALASIALASALGTAGPPVPANDNFAHATPVPVSGAMSGTTAGAGVQPGEPGVGSRDESVWFTWTPAGPGEAFVVPGGPGAPVAVRVYRGTTLASLVPVAAPGGTSTHASATIGAYAGVTYSLQVISPPNEAGPFHLSILQPNAGAPVNDAFAAATPLADAVAASISGHAPASSLSGTTAGATGQPGEPGSPRNSVWYRWTAPSGTNGSLAVTLSGVTGGRRLHVAVYAGLHLDSLRRVAGTGGERATFAVQSRRVYSVQVYGPPAYFTLHVRSLGGVPLDTTAPMISCGRPFGWHDRNVAAHCTARDGRAALANPAQASFKLSTAVPAGSANALASTNSVVVCDTVGNCATAGPITGVKVDLAPPLVSCDNPPSGWVSITVTVDCTASDPAGGSGLAVPGDGSFALVAALHRGVASPTVAFSRHPAICDVAGNCTPVPTPRRVEIDRSGPTVTCQGAPHGWIDHDVSVRCVAHDDGSGLLTPAEATFALTSSVSAGATVARAFTDAHEICDRAGNCTKVGPLGPLRIDREPPLVTCAKPTGWARGTSATVRCRAASHGAALARPADAAFRLGARIAAGSERLVETDTRRICDGAGNCTTAGPIAVELDDRPPTITCQPTPRGWLARAVAISCVASDAGSGVPAGRQLILLRASVAAGTATGDLPLPRRRICDAVGNCALTSPLAPMKVDRQAPIVRCVAPPAGRYRHNVRVQCSASDGHGAGLADPADASFQLSSAIPSGALAAHAHTSTRRVCDAVGNCATAGPIGPINIDLRPIGVKRR